MAMTSQSARSAEEALRTSESFLNSTIDQSPLPMWISDDRGTLIRINQACRDLLNISDEEVVGKYNILEDNIVEEQGFMPMVRRVFEAGDMARFELKYDSSKLKHLHLTRIIEVHGGRIWIESALGKGCTVCFTLPLADYQ